jgi:predicted ester cyclase
MSAQDTVNKHYDGFNNRTFEKNATDYIAPNFIYADAATGQEARGIEGYGQYANGWIATFPDAKIKITNQQVQGNRVITTFRGQGAFTGQLQTPQGTVPGNGRKVDVEFREEAEIANDKITRLSISYDQQELMRQLGLA